jgi:hypothetical protein
LKKFLVDVSMSNNLTVTGASAAGTLVSSGFVYGKQLQLAGLLNNIGSGTFYTAYLGSIINQPIGGTASNVDLMIDRTETNPGSGPQYLIQARTNGTDKLTLTNNGILTVPGAVLSNSFQFIGIPGYLAGDGSGNLVVSADTGQLQLSGDDGVHVLSDLNVNGALVFDGANYATGINQLRDVEDVLIYDWASGDRLFYGSGQNLTNLNADNIASGQVAPARLATGTPSASTFVRGDGTWSPVVAGSNTQIQYNNSGAPGASSNFTFNPSNGLFTVAGNAVVNSARNSYGLILSTPVNNLSYFNVYVDPNGWGGVTLGSDSGTGQVTFSGYGGNCINNGDYWNGGGLSLGSNLPWGNGGWGLRVENASSGAAYFRGAVKFDPAAAPSSPSEGMFYYDSTAHAPKFHNGSGWITVGAGGGGSVSAPLALVGTTDAVQLSVKANATQNTNPAVFAVRNSSNSIVMSVDSSGNVVSPSFSTGSPASIADDGSGGWLISADAGGVTITGDNGLVVETYANFDQGAAFYNGADFYGGCYFDDAGISILPWSGQGGWIDMPTWGACGIGTGGPGQNAWIAYAASSNQWFPGANAGDVCYRNTAGRILIGTNSGRTPDIIVDSAGTVSMGGNASVAGTLTATVVEKVKTFTPGSTGWYRIATRSSNMSGKLLITGSGGGRQADEEIHFFVNGWESVSAINQVNSLPYGGGAVPIVDQVRASGNAGDGSTYLDIHVNVASIPLTLYLYGNNAPAFLSTPTLSPTIGPTGQSVLTVRAGLHTTAAMSCNDLTVSYGINVTGMSGPGTVAAYQFYGAAWTDLRIHNQNGGVQICGPSDGGTVGIGSVPGTDKLTVGGTVKATSLNGPLYKTDCTNGNQYITLHQTGYTSGVDFGVYNDGGWFRVGAYNNYSYMSCSTDNGSPRLTMNRGDTGGERYIRLSTGDNWGGSHFFGNFANDGTGINYYTTDTYKLLNFNGTILTVTGRVRHNVLAATVASGGTLSPDWSTGTSVDVTANGNINLGNPTNAANGDKFEYRIYNNTGSAITVTLSGSNIRNPNYTIASIAAGKQTKIGMEYTTLGGVTKFDVIGLAENY